MNTEKQEHRCEMFTYRYGDGELHPCGKPAKYFEDGRLYCGIHASAEVKRQTAIAEKVEEAMELLKYLKKWDYFLIDNANLISQKVREYYEQQSRGVAKCAE